MLSHCSDAYKWVPVSVCVRSFLFVYALGCLVFPSDLLLLRYCFVHVPKCIDLLYRTSTITTDRSPYVRTHTRNGSAAALYHHTFAWGIEGGTKKNCTQGKTTRRSAKSNGQIYYFYVPSGTEAMLDAAWTGGHFTRKMWMEKDGGQMEKLQPRKKQLVFDEKKTGQSGISSVSHKYIIYRLNNRSKNDPKYYRFCASFLHSHVRCSSSTSGVWLIATVMWKIYVILKRAVRSRIENLMPFSHHTAMCGRPSE